ncbi:Eukaryotic translation initiation factor 3 subunit G [Bienertia sinuspersici]
MKGTKAKVIGQLRVVPDYEKKRWVTLKKNAEFMKSKGYGTLANKILQERAETWSKYGLGKPPGPPRVRALINLRNKALCLIFATEK